jgi:BirA family transcriptional regulator, biotin operon repressor / biotin---[acetyl-CoA-carboxylase] ligase
VRIDEIKRKIKGDLGKDILFYETTDSTNTIALKFAETNKEGLVILSDSQEKGRGRLGRRWISPPGVNIYMSIVLKPVVKPADATLITLMTAVACAVALRKITRLDIRIKWPNDLVVSDKKLGGILTELKVCQERIAFAVVGIGINVNVDTKVFPEEIREIATSVKNETGQIYSREDIIAEVLCQMHRWYSALKRMDRETILSGWRSLNSTLGREVVVTAGRETCKGFAENIDEEGMLLLRLPSGEVKKISSGDLRIPEKC